jgi:hypothetical protein
MASCSCSFSLAGELDETAAGIGVDGRSSFTEGTGGISPLSLRRRAFFFGVVEAVLTGVDEAEERGESTLISIVFCLDCGNGDLGIALDIGEPDDLFVSPCPETDSSYPLDEVMLRRFVGVWLFLSAQFESR